MERKNNKHIINNKKKNKERNSRLKLEPTWSELKKLDNKWEEGNKMIDHGMIRQRSTDIIINKEKIIR